MNHHHLLYVLEKVRSRGRYESLNTREGDEDHEACQQLAKDGLIHCIDSDSEVAENGFYRWRQV